MKKTIVIVDDHTLFAQSLQGLVNSFEHYEVLAVFKNGQELVDYFKTNNKYPDIVLLDIRMPVLNGVETMQYLKQAFPSQKVLALTMEHEEQTILKMVKLGCRGYLLKDIEPEEFLIALDCVYESGYYLLDNAAVKIDCSIKEHIVPSLNQREIEFLNLACSERTYKEVAREMNLSPKTIDGYRENLFNKLEVKSRVGMVLYAIKNQMVDI